MYPLFPYKTKRNFSVDLIFVPEGSVWNAWSLNFPSVPKLPFSKYKSFVSRFAVSQNLYPSLVHSSSIFLSRSEQTIERDARDKFS